MKAFIFSLLIIFSVLGFSQSTIPTPAGGGMVSWGLDTDSLSTEYKLNKLI